MNTLKYWIENFWGDFLEDPILLEKLTAFADSIEEENLANVMKPIITRKVRNDSAGYRLACPVSFNK